MSKDEICNELKSKNYNSNIASIVRQGENLISSTREKDITKASNAKASHEMEIIKTMEQHDNEVEKENNEKQRGEET